MIKGLKGRINSKKRIQKTLVAIILVLLLNFIVPNYSHADIGGVLIGPFTDFFSAVGDVVAAALQMFMIDGNFGNGTSNSLLKAFMIPADTYYDLETKGLEQTLQEALATQNSAANIGDILSSIGGVGGSGIGNITNSMGLIIQLVGTKEAADTVSDIAAIYGKVDELKYDENRGVSVFKFNEANISQDLLSSIWDSRRRFLHSSN